MKADITLLTLQQKYRKSRILQKQQSGIRAKKVHLKSITCMKLYQALNTPISNVLAYWKNLQDIAFQMPNTDRNTKNLVRKMQIQLMANQCIYYSVCV